MAIFYGSKEVKLIEDLKGDAVKVQYEDIVTDVDIFELEADGGIEEIHDAIQELKIKK